MSTDIALEPFIPDQTNAPAHAAARGAALIAEAAANGADHVELARLSVQWAHRTFASLVLMSSMGDEVLVHLASEAAPGIEVAFIDTGYHFAETLGTADAYASSRPLRLLTVTPEQTVDEQDAHYGAQLHRRDPDLCCRLRKVEPLERTLAGRDAWVTGMRRVDAPTRSDIEIIGVDAKRDMVKVNPLALWTEEQTQDYARNNAVLLNPLRQAGYASIGCAPCTRPTAPGEDPRAGRWSGTGKTECGLHV
ncbi:MAG: phosphoadenylyl-sulfate reductase [Candidatus Nanopelagicales bacterium]|jgi:phosphoadenosine phosphosulfate reductase|nr:phosphoadenylyl-sulfate reductase [Actinomycetota bacterium]HNL52716.1 phosphoadenylyl-sulfate reductase [Actinomycetota bacterium]